ncbi:MAG: hypothetical protein ACYTBZ_16895 [Planctomycetota bacterium]|jgi:hypothetical protein
MDNKNFAIGILSVTAVILFSSLLITNVLMPEKAMAFAQNAASGPYVVTTSQLIEYAELLIILHTPSERMNVYALNPQNGVIELIQLVDVKNFTREMERRAKSRRGYKRPPAIEREDYEENRDRKSRERRR